MLKISKGSDFITPIVDRYLTDLRVRKKEDMFSNKCPSYFLRRQVTLGDIDVMVDDTQSRILGLIEDAERIEAEILEEERLNQIKQTIKKHCR